MYAIMDIGGKQHKIKAGDVVRIDRMEEEAGKEVEFDQVLFISDENEIKIGTPVIEKAKVVAEVLGEIKDKKLISFKYKKRKSSSRKVGHRQKYTEIKIKEIVQ